MTREELNMQVDDTINTLGEVDVEILRSVNISFETRVELHSKYSEIYDKLLDFKKALNGSELNI